PLAVTRSACLFAMRVLTDPDIPPSAGAYRPIEVLAPEGTLLNARPGAAVAAGNVETSSRVADLVLSAFGRAQGQGTMNNLTLGDGDFSYYETIGGGQGACADGGGGSGACGVDLLDGAPLGGKATGTLRPGQRLRIETPGGGGFGRAPAA